MLEERCFRAAAAEAKQGSGRDWPAQRVPLSGRVARWLLGSASEFMLAAARAQRALRPRPRPRGRGRGLPGASEIMLSAARAERARRSRHQRTRSDRKLIFCLLSSPRCMPGRVPPPRPRIDSRASLSRRRLEPVKLEALRALLEERAAEKVARPPLPPPPPPGAAPCGPASSELPP
eukprot:tig00020855_g14684.t1